MNSPHSSFYLLKRTLVYTYIFPRHNKADFQGLAIWVLHFPLFYNEIMSKLSKNALIEHLTST